MQIRKKKRSWKHWINIFLILSLLSAVAIVPPGTAVTVQAATAAELIQIAASQVGYHEKASAENLDDFTANSGSANYTRYARDLGVANGQPWCAYFVWWCMKTAGVDGNAYPQIGSVSTDWFANRGLWYDRASAYVPKAGDYIAFGNAGEYPNHCGIVESVSGGKVCTIEGNSSDQVIRREYALGDAYIAGYGIIQYSGTGTPSVPAASTAPTASAKPTSGADAANPGAPYPIPLKTLGSGSRGNDVKWVQQCVNALLNAGLTVDGVYGSRTANAVKAFQSKYGLTADGVVGTLTRNKMLEVWRIAKATKTASPKLNVSAGKPKTVLATPKIKKLSNSKKKKVVVTLKKAVKNAQGYQLRYSTKKSMSSAKKCKMAGKNTLTKTVKRLKKNKKYYFSVRAYRKKNGKTYFSAWSSVKSVKIKK